MIAALLATALLIQEPQVQDLGTVQIGLREVAVVLPAPGAALVPSGQSVGSWQVEAGTLRPFLSDGGWGDAAELYRRAQGRIAEATAYPVLVCIQARSSFVEIGADGVVRQRRSGLERRQMDEIYAGLAQFKALAEAAAGGQVRIDVTVLVDDDPEYGVLESSATRDTLAEIESHVNSEPFESDDGVRRGPYSSVFVISGSLLDRLRHTRLAGAAATEIGYFTFTDHSPEKVLGSALLEYWVRHLWVNAGLLPAEAEATRVEPRVPSLGSLGIVDGLLEAGNVAARDPESLPIPRAAEPAGIDVGDLPALQWPYADPGAMVETSSSTIEFPVESWPVVQGSLTQAGQTARLGLRDGPGGVHAVARVPAGDRERAMAALGIVAAAPPEPDGTPRAIGDFSLTPTEGGFLVTQTGLNHRGGIVWESRSASDGFVAMTVTPASEEPLALTVMPEGGPAICYPISGPAFPVAVHTSMDVQLGSATIKREGTTLTVSVPVPAGRVAFRLGPPPMARNYERETLGEAKFSFTLPTVSDSNPNGSSPVAVPEIEAVLAGLGSLQGALSADDWGQVQTWLQSESDSIRLTTISRLASLRHADLVSTLAGLSQSASPSIAAVAVRSLKAQDSDEAWAAIASTLERGPFEFNRQFAAEALIERPNPALAPHINLLMASRTWRTRRAAVLALGATKSREASIILIAMLQDLNPAVRLAIVEQSDVSVELVARRLLWIAVNDNSQAVRSAAYVKLLGCPMDEYRLEAHKGVRDEMVAIRLAILAHMQAAPAAEHRQSLRLAVVDVSPRVRAAALDAFAAQPGPVEVGEVQNTFTDQDPRVRAALSRLAAAKGLQVPGGLAA